MTNNWQPIETAPRDGTEIIVCWIDGGYENDATYMLWDDEGVNNMFPGVEGMWRTASGSATWTEHAGHGPTHWMPIPVVH